LILNESANAISVRLNRATKRLQEKLHLWTQKNTQPNIWKN
jgi:hypothetical protein